MKNIKSHPDIQLSEHISQVMTAADAICQCHSNLVVTNDITNFIRKAAALHDTGKATDAFQKYIENPSAYRDDPMDKAHTPMSTLLVLLLSIKEKWSELETILLSAVIFGHHRQLPTIERLREIGSGVIPKILKRQISNLHVDSLSKHCNTNIKSLDLSDRPWAKAQRYLDNYALPLFDNLSIDEAVSFRLKSQLIFSILLEADKAFLAVKDPEEYINRNNRLWSAEWVEKKIGKPEDILINRIRSLLREEIINTIKKIECSGIYSLTAPTGSGKTLLSATWLLKLREKMNKKGLYPKIIIVLPFLSVIDQTTKEYEDLLTVGGEKIDGSWLLTSHSLSDRKYKRGLEEDTEHFFIDTWRTELVITTYDQFLMSLMDRKAKYQMRFHNLCDSLIVMDEVQSLPCKLWKPMEKILQCLVSTGNTSIMIMSATLPAIVNDAKPLLKDYSLYFKQFNRYKIKFRLEDKLNISNFCEELLCRRDKWLQESKRVLITFNTRRSARLMRDELSKNWPKEYNNVPLMFISADVTQKDRLDTIKKIKEGNPCIVVSTQCIEAGVDIDMDFVIRDFAPLDSIVQIAGRCNRNGKMYHQATIEVIDLVNEQGKRYSDMIYDDVHLQITRQLTIQDIEEKDILLIATKYFDMLYSKKDTGQKHLERFARWEDDISVRELLRGKEQLKHTFIVLEQDINLKCEMESANKTEDRWKRREAWKAIAGRIASISVSIYAKRGFSPESIAYEFCGHWILYDGIYSSERGLVLPGDSNDEIMIL